MATVTHLYRWNVTTGGSSYVSGSFTPAAGSLLAVSVSASAVTGTGTLTASANGITFVLVATATRASVDNHFFWVAEQLVPASPVSMTVTFSPGGTGTGVSGSVVSVSGLTRSGLSAVRNFAAQNGAATTPALALGPNAPALTGSPMYGVLVNASNPPGITEPSGFTKPVADAGFSNPTRGVQLIQRDSGFTGSTVTWGSASPTAWSAIVAEFDTSAPPAGSDFIGWGVPIRV